MRCFLNVHKLLMFVMIEKENNVISDILGNMFFESTDGNRITFRNDSGDKMVAFQKANQAYFFYKGLDQEKVVSLNLPDFDDDISDVDILEFIKTKSDIGCILEKREKKYIFNGHARVLVDLVSNKYEIDKDIDFDIDILNNDGLDTCVVSSNITFESHMSSVNQIKTSFNGNDISNLYNSVDGDNSISKIYASYSSDISDIPISDVTVKKIKCYSR